jgi:hypothetical protein
MFLQIFTALLITMALLCSSVTANVFAQIESWQTYVDPQKKFVLNYPPGWTAKAKDNVFSSIDLTLTDTISSRPFQIAISYFVNDSSLSSAGSQHILPVNGLRNLEEQIKPAYQLYSIVNIDTSAYSIYGFPTASNTVDYIKHSGDDGKLVNIFAVVKDESSFFVSYSNSKHEFSKLLPTLKEMIGSIVILK